MNIFTRTSPYLLGLLAVFSFINQKVNAAPLKLESAPVTAQLLGGDNVDLRKSPIASITTSEYSCSGVLVGPREVITAAHCLATPNPADDYRVFVGGNEYLVEKVEFNRNYDPQGTVNPSNSRYDLGILTLTEAPHDVKIIPIMLGVPPKVGQKSYLFGYGINETSGFSEESELDRGRAAQIKVAKLLNGMFTSTQANSGASTCAGDSGGPVLQKVGNYLAVIGIVSAGTNSESFGFCDLDGGGESLYVNLQSKFSNQFLTQFSGLKFLSGKTASLQAQSLKIKTELVAALQNGKLSVLRRALRSLKGILPRLQKYASGAQKRQIRQAIMGVKNGLNAQKASSVAKYARSVLSRIESLAAANP